MDQPWRRQSPLTFLPPCNRGATADDHSVFVVMFLNEFDLNIWRYVAALNSCWAAWSLCARNQNLKSYLYFSIFSYQRGLRLQHSVNFQLFYLDFLAALLEILCFWTVVLFSAVILATSSSLPAFYVIDTHGTELSSGIRSDRRERDNLLSKQAAVYSFNLVLELPI